MNTKNINPIAYFLITLIGGFFGLHKFLDGNVKMGIIYIFTFGLFGVGWIFDIVSALIIMLEYIIKSPNKSTRPTSYNESTNNKQISNTSTSKNPMIAEDGNMYTKLRAVTKDSLFVMGLNRQQALDSIDESTTVHFEFSNDINKKLLVVTDDTGIDLGEFTEERKNYLLEHYDNVLKIKPKIKKITGGNDGNYYGCNIALELSSRMERSIINEINQNTDEKNLGNANYNSENNKLAELLPYNLEFVSESGGYMNCNLYKIEIKNGDSNNEITSLQLTAKSETKAISKVKEMSNNEKIEIISIELLELELATKEQITEAETLGYAIPENACYEDAECIISRAKAKEYENNISLAKTADKIGCTFSTFASEKQLINLIANFEDDKIVAAFYFYVFKKYKAGTKLMNMYTFKYKNQCFDFAEKVYNDEKTMKSIRKSLPAAPDISTGTVAYRAANNFNK